MSHVILEELRERLLSGYYPIGSRISIEGVKAEFGVSKQPVMDAMRRLEAIGIVEIVPQSGCRVMKYPAQEIEDFFALFGRFEGEIAATAAIRRSQTQLVEMDTALRRLAEVEEIEDPVARSSGYRVHNRGFHLVVHQMSHSSIMGDLSGRMWDLSDFFIYSVGGARVLSDRVHSRNDDHHLIGTAIRSGNAEVARVAMESHILDTVKIVRPTGLTTHNEVPPSRHRP